MDSCLACTSVWYKTTMEKGDGERLCGSGLCSREKLNPFHPQGEFAELATP